MHHYCVPHLARPAPPSLRSALALALRRTSDAAARLALAVDHAPAGPSRPLGVARLEFHADAGAPEGALYVDGELVGRLEGVHRL